MGFLFNNFREFPHKGNDSNVGFQLLDENNKIYLYKYCRSDACFDEYLNCFKHEFFHMRSLEKYMEEKNEGSTYHRLFPQYYDIGYRTVGGKKQAYIVMEYIPGDTLQSFLESKSIGVKTFPHKFFKDQQILRIFQQINEIQHWLNQKNMLQLDLNPCNIIITEENSLTIKMIDFTDVFYFSSRIREERKYYNKNRTYKLFDDFFSSENNNLSPAMQLRDAGILLYGSLFYNSYDTYKADNPFKNPSRVLELYLEIIDRTPVEYINISNHKSDQYLVYWNTWYSNLEKILKRSFI